MTQLQRAFYLLTTRKLANFDFASHYILQYQRVIHDLRHRYGFNVIMERTENPKINMYYIIVPDGCFANFDTMKFEEE